MAWSLSRKGRYLHCLDKEEHAETSHWYALFKLKKD